MVRLQYFILKIIQMSSYTFKKRAIFVIVVGDKFRAKKAKSTKKPLKYESGQCFSGVLDFYMWRGRSLSWSSIIFNEERRPFFFIGVVVDLLREYITVCFA